MNILRVILATLVIFGTGAVSGYFVAKKQISESRSDSPRERSSRSRDGNPAMDRGRKSFMDRLERDLELTDEQRETITEIFAKSGERTREIWKQMKEPMDVEIERVREEVKSVLTSEQATRFDEINEQWDERRRNRRHKPPEAAPKPGPGEQCSNWTPPLHQCAL